MVIIRYSVEDEERSGQDEEAKEEQTNAIVKKYELYQE